MSNAYAKIPHGERKRGGKTASRPLKNIRVDFPGKHPPEQLTRFLQMFIAELESRNVRLFGNFSIYFAPLDRHGDRMALSNEKGEPLEVMRIGYKKPAAPEPVTPEIARSFAAKR